MMDSYEMIKLLADAVREAEARNFPTVYDILVKIITNPSFSMTLENSKKFILRDKLGDIDEELMRIIYDFCVAKISRSERLTNLAKARIIFITQYLDGLLNND